MKKYKVLINKITNKFAVILEDKLFESPTPIMLPHDATMKQLKEWSKADLTNYILRDVELKIKGQ